MSYLENLLRIEDRKKGANEVGQLFRDLFDEEQRRIEEERRADEEREAEEGGDAEGDSGAQASGTSESGETRPRSLRDSEPA